MFTGIVKHIGSIYKIEPKGTNIEFTILSDLSNELQIDESVSHQGICLTVTQCNNQFYKVTAVQETILKTTIKQWQIGDQINLERSLKLIDLMGGHMVQGHIDSTFICDHIVELEGSWIFRFQYSRKDAGLIIPQGSISINGVSLTISKLTEEFFEVSIIPYTFYHTTFQYLKVGNQVNIEFDILGKYFIRNFELYNQNFNKFR